MSKHTPGPWTGSDECDWPDAHLIAAAPDLLDAVCRALPFIEDAKVDPAYKPGAVAEIERLMRAAIAKATGEQPC